MKLKKAKYMLFKAIVRNFGHPLAEFCVLTTIKPALPYDVRPGVPGANISRLLTLPHYVHSTIYKKIIKYLYNYKPSHLLIQQQQGNICVCPQPNFCLQGSPPRKSHANTNPRLPSPSVTFLLR